MNWQYILIAFLGGVATCVQVPLNALLAKGLQSAIWGAMISFFVGFLGLIGYAVWIQDIKPNFANLSTVPWWGWLGGLLGAFFVTGSIIAAPRIGATLFIGLIIFGQMIAALLVDHYGFAGFNVATINVGRIAGVLLVIVGVLLIKKF